MGCDIHCYIETNNREPRAGEKRYWTTFVGNINPGRDYHLFGILAGVRSDNKPMIPVRGLPEDMAWFQTQTDAYLRISDSDGDGLATQGNAEAWISNGDSVWLDDSHTHVSHPDYHSHSWMTPDEWRRAINIAPDRPYLRAAEYFAIAAAMDELRIRGLLVRIVFWFDN